MAKKRFAATYWTVEDVNTSAEDLEIEVTPDEAERLLSSNEKRIAEAEARAGFEIIEHALLGLLSERKGRAGE